MNLNGKNKRATYDDLRASLVDMKRHMIANDVEEISMPRIVNKGGRFHNTGVMQGKTFLDSSTHGGGEKSGKASSKRSQGGDIQDGIAANDPAKVEEELLGITHSKAEQQGELKVKTVAQNDVHVQSHGHVNSSVLFDTSWALENNQTLTEHWDLFSSSPDSTQPDTSSKMEISPFEAAVNAMECDDIKGFKEAIAQLGQAEMYRLLPRLGIAHPKFVIEASKKIAASAVFVQEFCDAGQADDALERHLQDYPVVTKTNMMAPYAGAPYENKYLSNGPEEKIAADLAYRVCFTNDKHLRITCFGGKDHTGKTSVVRKITTLAVYCESMDGVLVVEAKNVEDLKTDEKLRALIQDEFKKLTDKDTLDDLKSQKWLLTFILPSSVQGIDDDAILSFISCLDKLVQESELRVMVRLPFVNTQIQKEVRELSTSLVFLQSPKIKQEDLFRMVPQLFPHIPDIEKKDLRNLKLKSRQDLLQLTHEQVENAPLKKVLNSANQGSNEYPEFQNSNEFPNFKSRSNYGESAPPMLRAHTFNPHMAYLSQNSRSYDGDRSFGYYEPEPSRNTLNPGQMLRNPENIAKFYLTIQLPGLFQQRWSHDVYETLDVFIIVALEYFFGEEYHGEKCVNFLPSKISENIYEYRITSSYRQLTELKDPKKKSELTQRISNTFRDRVNSDLFLKPGQSPDDTCNGLSGSQNVQQLWNMLDEMTTKIEIDMDAYREAHPDPWDNFSYPSFNGGTAGGGNHAQSFNPRGGGLAPYKNSVRNDSFTSYTAMPEQRTHTVQAKNQSFNPHRKKSQQKKIARSNNSNYRQRQNLVQSTRALVKELLGNRLIDDDANTYLRGPHVLFIPSKSPGSLLHIAQFVKEIDLDQNVTIKSAALPLSRKNEFQLKGFLAYLEMGSAQEVKYVQDNIYEPKYKNHFQKCVPAEFKKSFRENTESPANARSTGPSSWPNNAAQTGYGRGRLRPVQTSPSQTRPPQTRPLQTDKKEEPI